MATLRSSGDLIADRRFDHAMGYRAAGEHAAAAELIAQALEIVPRWVAGWLALGEACEAAGDRAGALSAFETALSLDPADAVGAGARLARLGARSAEGAVTAAHVAALFDDYAPRFETALVEGLAYRAPALMRALLDEGGPRRFSRAIDIGCGTGLCGAVFADCCARIDGVDLSPAMLAIAAGKGLYTDLACAEAVAHLGSLEPASHDLALAADVLVYIGDLGALFRAVARILTPGGIFLFTVQDAGEEMMRLGEDLRYAHGAAALHDWAVTAGLAVTALTAASTRLDAGRPVPGLVAIVEARATQTDGSKTSAP